MSRRPETHAPMMFIGLVQRSLALRLNFFQLLRPKGGKSSKLFAQRELVRKETLSKNIAQTLNLKLFRVLLHAVIRSRFHIVNFSTIEI